MNKDKTTRTPEIARRLKTTGKLLEKAQKEVEAAHSAEAPILGLWCDLTSAKAKTRRLLAASARRSKTTGRN